MTGEFERGYKMWPIRCLQIDEVSTQILFPHTLHLLSKDNICIMTLLFSEKQGSKGTDNPKITED